jgi:uncharacterized protein with beta-barrel porin domain
MGRTAEGRRVLLATSSLAALAVGWNGTAQAACSVANPPTPYNNSASIDCVTFNDGLNHVGNVTNTASGTITAPGIGGGGPPELNFGISLFMPLNPGGTTTVTGDIVNNGLITSVFTNNNTPINGIGVSGGLLPGSVVTGSVINNNQITVTGFGFWIGSNVGGDVVNNKNTDTGWTAINVTGTNFGGKTTVGGSVINNGTITFTPHPSANPAFEYGIGVLDATVKGNVSNAGSITTIGQTGIAIFNKATVVGAVGNTGTITATGTSANSGAFPVGIGVFSSTVGSIQNTGNGSITADQYGILMLNLAKTDTTVSGSITNSASITSNGGAGFAGIAVAGGASVTHDVTNAAGGVIKAANSAGILITNVTPSLSFSAAATVAGQVVNQGTITAKTGILVNGGSTVGGISNTGSIFAGAGIGMGVFAATVGGVQNSNTIIAGLAGISLGTATVAGSVTNTTAGNIQVGNGVGILVTNVTPAGTGPTTISGQVVNQGNIFAKTGIQIVGSTITGGIINTGNITGTTTAIDLVKEATATTFTQAGGSITGDILLSPLGDTVNITGGAIAGNIKGTGTGTVNFAPVVGVFSYDNVISGVGAVNVNSGFVALSGTNTYTGVTNVNGGGVLDLIGSIATSSLTTIKNGAELVGTGTVGATSVLTGGTLLPGTGAPGTSLKVSGSLAFQSGAFYAVTVNPATASFTSVTGTATLGGATVDAFFNNGAYVHKQYTILSATGGVSGTFNPTVVNFNLPANFKTSLSYDANDAFLNLQLDFTAPGGGLNTNQQGVANTITNFFNTTGELPVAFLKLAAAGLTQASGELATGSQQTTFDAMTLFMSMLTDPFMRSGGGMGPSGAVLPYAGDDPMAKLTQRERDAYAAVYGKAPPVSFTQRWDTWAAAFGGSQTTDGNVILGSNKVTSRIAGVAAGADYRFSPDTLAGFAIAGGGTSFALDNALGSGRSDLFQAGVYMHHREGPAYIAAALAYGWQDITTDRTVAIAGIDQLHAQFHANAWSGRIEGGYRFGTPWGMGITPYAAAQFVTFALPAYAETAVAGGAFALAYGARTVSAPRTEVGFRSDESFAMANGVLTLRGRLAWAQNSNPDRFIGATFEALPGASFVVNGAAQARDSALTTASAEMRWINGWSAAATFEGEFSNVTRSYAGKGVVRYTW